jgi:antitoxin YefM
MAQVSLQHISDENGKTTSVVVPIELWHEIESERETAYLLKSKAMKKRLLDAKKRSEGVSLEQAREKLEI